MTLSQDRSQKIRIEDDRTGLNIETIKRAIAVAELMRLLVDEHDYEWDKAWQITQNTLGYTNHTLLPEKFNSKTNGVTRRRWMVLSNPRLSGLITEKIGDRWIKDLSQLQQLEPLVDDAEFRQQWQDTQQAIKQDLADYTTENLCLC